MTRTAIENSWQQQEWNQYYLNHRMLKKAISRKIKRAHKKQNRKYDKPFEDRLDDEVGKVVLFFLRQQGRIAGELLVLNHALARTLGKNPVTPKRLSDPILSTGTDAVAVHSSRSSHKHTTNLETSSSTPEHLGETVGTGKLGTVGQLVGVSETYQLSMPVQSMSLTELADRFRQVGADLRQLLGFLETNVVALREVLADHDRRVRFGPRLQRQYLLRHLQKKGAAPAAPGPPSQLLQGRGSGDKVYYSNLQQLYSNEGMVALTASLRRSLAAVHSGLHEPRMRRVTSTSADVSLFHSRNTSQASSSNSILRGRSGSYGTETSLRSAGGIGRASSQAQPFLHDLYGIPPSYQLHRTVSELEPILTQLYFLQDRVRRSQERTTSETLMQQSDLMLESNVVEYLGESDSSQSTTPHHTLMGDAFVGEGEMKVNGLTPMSDYFIPGSQQTSPYRSRQASLDISPFRARQASLEGPHFRSRQASADTQRVMGRSAGANFNSLSFYLNLLCTCLYVTNYTVIAPTSAHYASALGANEGFSGVIMGTLPIAGCVSCFLWSWWTNYTFRRPLLCGVLLLVTGNLCYSLALTFKSFNMAILGQVLNGLGGTRGVNRRYIADTVAFHHRTMASAMFVTAGALGVTLGPVIAFLMSDLFLHVPLGSDLTLEITPANGPGVCLFLLWSTLGVLIFFGFQEPTFRHQPRPIEPLKKEPAISPNEDDTDDDTDDDEDEDNYDHNDDHKRGALAQGRNASSSVEMVPTGGLLSSAEVVYMPLSGEGGSGGGYGSAPSASPLRQSSPLAPPASTSTVPLFLPSMGLATRPHRVGSRSALGMFESEQLAPLAEDGDTEGDHTAEANSHKAQSHTTANNAAMIQPSPAVAGTTGSSATRRRRRPKTRVKKETISWPIVVLLLFYFANKMTSELVVNSSALITAHLFGWGVAEVSVLLIVLGAVILPTNLLVGKLSQSIEDRRLLVVLGGCVIVGLVVVVKAWPGYSEAHYLAGCIITFVAAQAHEGVLMSELSKIISPEMARGAFNSGLLATESGTFGRAVGDFLLSAVAVLTDLEPCAVVFLPSLILFGAVVYGTWAIYDRLM
uniref:SPX domain-containing protein n=1 Tax=Fibrocapsa japonica TaxID=94617 RepID=A0A7S2UW59_9STRA